MDTDQLEAFTERIKTMTKEEILKGGLVLHRKREGERLDAPPWVTTRGGIDEPAFFQCFGAEGYRCIHGRLCDTGGFLEDDVLLQQIQEELSPFIKTDLARKASTLLKALKNRCRADPPPLETGRLHLKNGTLSLSPWQFSENLCFAANRLPVSYVEEFLPPNLWLKFLSELLHEEDILTLQEYLGYCLIPTKRAQKMLFLIGGGGEGKSVIGGVLRDIFGSSLLSGKLKDLEGDNFILASLEGALVFLDDDITSCGFQESQTIKSLVTDMQPTQVNPKGQKRYSAVLYPRLIAFGNMAMTTLYDHSDGVFRRRLILTTKEKPKNRIDDVYLPEKLRKETSSIFLWCAEGLLRLQQNGYRFTQSDRTKKNLEESRRDSFNLLSFLEDDNYLVFDPDCKSSTTYLYEMYTLWCHENSETPIKAKTMVTYLKQHSGKYQITYSENLIFSNTRKRGFKGLGVNNPHGYCV